MHYDYDEEGLSPKQRKAKLQNEIAQIKEQLQADGKTISPIETKPRAKIAKSFWAKKWYENLSTYEDLDHRLPLGRQLLSLGAVLDLKVEDLNITAKVYDEQTIYPVAIKFQKVEERQKTELSSLLQKDLCSLADLLVGKVSEENCQHITHSEHGLFPKLEEISFECNCTDYAELCSHGAACLCAVVVLFNQDPSLFFQLRGLHPQDLLQQTNKKEVSENTLSKEELSDVFGINLAD